MTAKKAKIVPVTLTVVRPVQFAFFLRKVVLRVFFKTRQNKTKTGESEVSTDMGWAEDRTFFIDIDKIMTAYNWT